MMTRRAVITGATKGIGKAIALRLAKDGFKLVLNYHHDDASANQTLRECMEAGVEALLVKADVGNRPAVRELVGRAVSEFGGVDVLINNAGLNIDRPMLEMTEEEWDRV